MQRDAPLLDSDGPVEDDEVNGSRKALSYRRSLTPGQWLRLALDRPELVGQRDSVAVLTKAARALGDAGVWMNACVAMGQAANREGTHPRSGRR